MEHPGVFRLLNETRDLDWPIDWSAPGADLLWRYNLHYFDDLAAEETKPRHALLEQVIEQWVGTQAQGTRPGWDPYPLSLRAVNWIKWHAAGNALSQSAIASLASQLRWLAARLEWHLLGNHLFANAKALIFAGCFFSGREADGWLADGLRIVARELDEQILNDGGNFELSPMYHAIFLNDLLDLVNIARRYPGRVPSALEQTMRVRVQRMLEWMALMVHPDGAIALFNDSALGIAPDLEDLRAYAGRLSIAVPAGPLSPSPARCRADLLPASGYARLATAEAAAFCDVAKVGPDYLPGHAHADTLSFELSVRGSRVIVNGGTSRYGSDTVRLTERGTAAHSTVVVDGANSSEVWSGFRVARRARPFAISLDVEPDRVSLCGSHDGYRRLHGDIDHSRRWIMTPGQLRIEDVVSGPWQSAVARYILHSSIEAEAVEPHVWLLRAPVPAARPLRLHVEGGRSQLEPAWHSLEFGKRLATSAITVELTQGCAASVTIVWADDANPVFH